MPEDIENYVHRIGRTGRRGLQGMSTTFVNRSIEEAVLLDLKHLLIEAKQKVPEFLEGLGTELGLDFGIGNFSLFLCADANFSRIPFQQNIGVYVCVPT